MPRFDDTNLPGGNAVGGAVEGWPCGGYITQVFGQVSVTGSRHGGMDIGAPGGTPVYAPDAGMVREVHSHTEGRQFGSYVVLQHEDGRYSAYAHLSAWFVVPGQWVNEGDLIGAVGSTGLSTGPHLHWAVSTNPAFALDFAQLSDPASYITEDEDDMTPEEREALNLARDVLYRWGIPAIPKPGTIQFFPPGTPEVSEDAEGPVYLLTGENAEGYVKARGFAFGLSLLNHQMGHPVTNHVHQTAGHFIGAEVAGENGEHQHVDPAANTTGVTWVQTASGETPADADGALTVGPPPLAPSAFAALGLSGIVELPGSRVPGAVG